MQHCWTLIYIAATVLVANCHVQDLHVNVIPLQSRFAATQDVNVILKYTNDGTETMGIYKWSVPQNGLFDPIFEVTRNGQPVEYVGPIVKRRAPTIDDIIYLAPGTSVSTTIELSSIFNMTQTGNYVIQYKMEANEVLLTVDNTLGSKKMLSNDDEQFILESAPVMVFAVGHRNLIIEEGTKDSTQGRALTPTYISCTASQSSTIRSGVTAAENYANSAVQYLNAQPSATARFTTWFGQYAATNWQTLKSHFSKLQSVLSTKTISFDCSCPAAGAGTYAYVYSNQHYKVFLCDEYWRAAVTGTDSQGGTIIHEIAHFAVVVGTADHAYGHNNAKALARSSPTRALQNSDNLQYFAENNPRLS